MMRVDEGDDFDEPSSLAEIVARPRQENDPRR